MTTAEAQDAWPDVKVICWLGDGLGPPRDQGLRGTCTAFATTTAHEHLRADQLTLSPEYLFWGAKQRDGAPNEDGTTLEAILLALRDGGQPEEHIWPYDGNLTWPDSSYAPPNPPYACYESAHSALPCTVEAIISSLGAGRAVILAVEVTRALFDAPEGRIPATPVPDEVLAYHALTAVGYVELEDGRISVIVRNSWGVDWGWRGYGLLPVEYIGNHLIGAAELTPK